MTMPRASERGLKLSGGELQRIAVTRVLYGNATILLHDLPVNVDRDRGPWWFASLGTANQSLQIGQAIRASITVASLCVA